MGTGVMRGVAAAGTVMVAAAVNVATGMLTQHWAAAWWAATGVLVVVGGGLQWWLTVAERTDRPSLVSASGEGAVAAGGSVRNASTRVRRSGPGRQVRPDSRDGVSASGPGAIAAGSDIEEAHTQVTGEGPTTP